MTIKQKEKEILSHTDRNKYLKILVSFLPILVFVLGWEYPDYGFAESSKLLVALIPLFLFAAYVSICTSGRWYYYRLIAMIITVLRFLVMASFTEFDEKYAKAHEIILVNATLYLLFFAFLEIVVKETLRVVKENGTSTTDRDK